MNSTFFQAVTVVSKGDVISAPAPEYEQISLLQDHSYSWWVEPRNVYHNGVNYWTTIGYDGNSYVHRYDGVNPIQSVQVRTYSQRDEHNAPAMLFRENDILVVMHPRNGSDFLARTISYDFETLGDIIDVNAGAGFGNANYAHVYQNSNGRIFIFCREDGDYWAITYSDDDGLTWSQHKRIFHRSGEKLYMSGVQNGDKIVFGGYTHPNLGSTNFLWSVEFDTISGEFTHEGSLLGDVYDSGWSYQDASTFTPLFEPTLGKMRFLDISFSSDKNIINALCVDIQSDNEDGKYYLVKFNKNTLEILEKVYIVDTGYDTYTTYYGGAYFVQDESNVWNNTIYLSRVEQDIWHVEEYVFDGAGFTKTKEIDSLEAGAAGLSLTRPEPPIGSTNGGLKLIYQEGDYDESYTNWDNEIIGVQ